MCVLSLTPSTKSNIPRLVVSLKKFLRNELLYLNMPSIASIALVLRLHPSTFKDTIEVLDSIRSIRYTPTLSEMSVL